MAYKEAPGPVGHALFGSLLEIRHDRLKFVTDITRQYGHIVRFRMGPKVFHLINEPDSIKHVLKNNSRNYQKGIGLAQSKPLLGEGLLTSEGELWAQQRQTIQPVFYHQRMSDYFMIMTDSIKAVIDQWASPLENGAPFDILSKMLQLTLCILGRAIFKFDFQDKTEILSSALTVIMRQAIQRMVSIIELPIILPTPSNLRLMEAIKTLDQIIYTMINERRTQKMETNDFLTIILNAQENSTRHRMDDKQLRDEAMSILLAGHETTAVALTWIWYLISTHPETEQKLLFELENVLGDRHLSFQDLSSLKYNKAVIEECLRLYPPVWLIPRKAIKDDVIRGFWIPANTGVLISPYSMHRNPDFWEFCNDFYPERFITKTHSSPVAYSYLPFGAGSHSCIGSYFGMMEIQLIIALILQKYRVNLLRDQIIGIEPLLTLRPSNNILMSLHRR